ncbi:MAG: type III-A CRISPR-associated protein Cas10/Csm1 [Geminicoccaceae bacterium]|nr:type III-A CRISPR-associated protein Cas10/Csm1 [Geminicoccaceae bacterium]
MSDARKDLPTIDEVALGAFLHDAGKLLQRGLGTIDALPGPVRNLEGTLCPKAPVGEYYTHKHVLFTELLFSDLEEKGLILPAGLSRKNVRDAAVWHHKPDSGPVWGWIVAEADRLASGMDRKEKDAAAERDDDQRTRDVFRRTPLYSILSAVRLADRALPQPRYHRPRPADATSILASAEKPERELIDDYRETTDAFRRDWVALCRELRQSASVVHEGAIGLGERYWWGVPSSTKDEPDVSLLDHSLAVAAFAACLYAHHAARDELLDATAIRDRTRPKFRLLRGDLSGIQHALFRLGSEQVKGVNRILRARSFLLSQLVEAAALAIRRAFGLPPYVVLMRAGGQFTMLLPELPDVEARIEDIRTAIDRWMAERYAGELALNLGLTEALPPTAFLRERILETLDRLRAATEAAKERPLATFLRENGVVLRDDYEAGADGYCPACGVRPRKSVYVEDGIARCWACHHEYRLGRRLPKLKQLLWLDGPGDEKALDLFGEVRLRAVVDDEQTFDPRPNVVSGWRPWREEGEEEEVAWPVATRPIANYVPTFDEGDLAGAEKYRGIEERDGGGETEEPIELGALKTMAHLAAEARESVNSRWIGRPLLAVLKADVDNLGRIFGEGLGVNRSIGRLVALSRALDWYFTGRLPWLLEKNWPQTYTVYAGGDDLLLIGPWWRMLKLAAELRGDFGRYCGGNPSLSLSAGIAFVSAREPLNRSAKIAEDALEAAKARPGKDAIGIVNTVLSWTDPDRGLPWLLRWSDSLCEQLREDQVKTAFAYKLLSFLELRAKAEDPKRPDPWAAIWRARYCYFLARTYPPSAEERAARRTPGSWEEFHVLMGLDAKGDPPPSELAIAFALWRNR